MRSRRAKRRPSRATGVGRRSRHLLRRLATIVMVTFLGGFLGPATVDVIHSLSGVDQVSHSDGTRCPDPADQDHPCGPACSCACCHVPLAVPDLPFSPGAVIAFDVSSGTVHAPDDLHPNDVPLGIFHPPRV